MSNPLIGLICLFITILSSFYLGWLYGYELGWDDKTKKKKHRLRNFKLRRKE